MRSRSAEAARTANPAGVPGGASRSGSFEAEVEGVSLQGDVTTGVLGADVSRDRWLAGIAVSSSRGDGPFQLTGGRGFEPEAGRDREHAHRGVPLREIQSLGPGGRVGDSQGSARGA